MKNYVFKCAGQFAGLSSFTDDGEDKNFLKIDFLGGRVNLEINEELADLLSGKKVGSDVRASGSVVVSGGAFRPVIEKMSFDGDKDFEAVSMEEAFAGLVFTGPGVVTSKNSFTRRDGEQVCEVKLELFGASVTLPVEESQFESIPRGQVIVSCRIVSEVAKDYRGRVTSKNWASLVGVRSMNETRKR
ncbi:MAG: hypothetical protein Q4C70_04955 [Planctomycetia bacterium]|nr:hypothetical protein [Planctomycetia bacterium]